MPRLLRLVALALVLLLVGAPAVLAEALEDDCADECASEEGQRSCPEEGCTDCSVFCPSCARTHVVAPSAIARLSAWSSAFVCIATHGAERVPPGPPPEGVFHPPRRAG